MKSLTVLLSDQLTHDILSLRATNPKTDIVLLMELREETTYLPHHPKKIAFWFASQRHFAKELTQQGYTVRYVEFSDPKNTHTLESEILRAIKETNCKHVRLTEVSEMRLVLKMEKLKKYLPCPLEIHVDDRFLCSIADFKKWVSGKKQLRMEFFYREMRKKFCILLESDGKPVGGKWNYDKENRKPPAKGLYSPKRISHTKTKITKSVLDLVEKEFPDHFGKLRPFYFALTRKEALIEARHFIDKILPNFGDYQDAMVQGEAYLFHSLLATYINAGLLLPLEICKMAEKAYLQKKAPLHAVEGFIRQILGWREYVRGIYWTFMPDYAKKNFFKAEQSLPSFYWGEKTKMNCVREAVQHTREHAYSHHIQRLMVTGNFALLAGIDPQEVCDWYLMVYADAYDWVELPNTLGMALHADGGIMASKPYAASGKYIQRMSNYCKGCDYDPSETTNTNSCPFNSLYWNFLHQHEKLLRPNHRLPFAYSTWDKMEGNKRKSILKKAKDVMRAMKSGEL